MGCVRQSISHALGRRAARRPHVRRGCRDRHHGVTDELFTVPRAVENDAKVSSTAASARAALGSVDSPEPSSRRGRRRGRDDLALLGGVRRRPGQCTRTAEARVVAFSCRSWGKPPRAESTSGVWRGDRRAREGSASRHDVALLLWNAIARVTAPPRRRRGRRARAPRRERRGRALSSRKSSGSTRATASSSNASASSCSPRSERARARPALHLG